MVKKPLIDVQNLVKYFPVKKGLFGGGKEFLHAVDNVSFQIRNNEVLGLVGESGCGKTTCARTILRLYEPTAGKVYFDGTDVFALSRKEMRLFRVNMQYIFQDPYSSLNPRRTIGNTLREPLYTHGWNKGEKVENRVHEVMEMVRLDPDEHIDRYPHEFSGGQRQRIAIARSIVTNPRFIIADEPVSALDVSVQAKVLNLLKDLQRELGLTILMIAHDLSVVRQISDRVAVMYLGKIVEIGGHDSLYTNPLHPYTKALLSAVPIPDPEVEIKPIILPGDVPTPIDPPQGCRFHPRCSYAMDICSKRTPALVEEKGNHRVACFLYHEKYEKEMADVKKGRFGQKTPKSVKAED